MRGLLLVYDCMVFADTVESIDEVSVHVFLLSIPQTQRTLSKQILQQLQNLLKYEKDYHHIVHHNYNVNIYIDSPRHDTPKKRSQN